MWGIRNQMGEDSVYHSARVNEHGAHAGMGSHGNEDCLVLRWIKDVNKLRILMGPRFPTVSEESYNYRNWEN